MTPLAETHRTLIDDLLAEQQQLTAVERFARKHEQGAVPAQERYYRDLIPLEKPGAGEQFAFAVDLDACTGCKACVSACHSLNGLEEDEIWRNVGLIHGGTVSEPYQQTVTTACHHCADPACLNGCPVMAYEKDAETGIVRHLDDQCIGCQYCVLKCPYDVPKYSKKRGIVRKCDMCYNRLAADEAPACVQACPNEAIAIRIVSKTDLEALTSHDRLLPGTFASDYTKPATSYTTRKQIPVNARAGDAHRPPLQHPHWPLIWMLVLTQGAVGLFVADALMAFLAPENLFFSNLAAFAVLNAGLGVSVLHLGRPFGAWRAFLGLRTSWMSREILAFSLFAGVAALFTAASGGSWLVQALTPWLSPEMAALAGRVVKDIPTGWLGLAAAATALLSVFCSVMIYVDTRRPFWSARMTATKFFGSMIALGAGMQATLLAWMGMDAQAWLALATVTLVGLGLWELGVGRAALRRAHSTLGPATRTMWRHQRPLLLARCILGLAGCLAFGLSLGFPRLGTSIFVLSAFAAFILERYSFFTAVDAPRMPGGTTA